MNVKMSETTSTPGRETDLEKLVDGAKPSQKIFIASPKHCLDTIVTFESPKRVKKMEVHANDIPYFSDPTESVFGYTVKTSKGKDIYLSLCELEEGSSQVDFNSPLVPILNLCGDFITYQDLLHLENEQLRSMLGEKDRENKNLSKQTQRFKRLALRDELTGCFNANSYSIDKKRHVINSIENNTPMFYLEADLTNLKMLNDFYGKNVGDEALNKLGTLMRVVFRRERRDFVYRFGGDEFGVMIYDSNLEGVATRVELFKTLLGTLRIKNPHYAAGEMPECDKYIKVAADLWHDKVSFGDLSVTNLREKTRQWYDERFAMHAKIPIGDMLTVNKLASTDPNMATHIRTAKYKAGPSSEPRVENRSKRFLREEVLNGQTV